VKVIGHEAVGDDPHGDADRDHGHYLEERLVVAVLMEDGGAGASAVEDVVAVATGGGACGARHGERFKEPENRRNYSRELTDITQVLSRITNVPIGPPPLRGRIIYLRRTDAAGRAEVLGRSFEVDVRWVHRLVRAEVNLKDGTIRFYRLRRREPGDQPLIREVTHWIKNKFFLLIIERDFMLRPIDDFINMNIYYY
jgi:hypothetical protein